MESQTRFVAHCEPLQPDAVVSLDGLEHVIDATRDIVDSLVGLEERPEPGKLNPHIYKT